MQRRLAMRAPALTAFLFLCLSTACTSTTLGTGETSPSSEEPPPSASSPVANHDDPPSSDPAEPEPTSSSSTATPTEPPAKQPDTLPLPPLGQVTIDEGGPKLTCINATAELLDPSSSSPRFILWADCPEDRLSMVVYPTTLPGTAKGPPGLRLMDVDSHEDWTSTDSTLTVTTLEKVGGVVEGTLVATMSPRLNQSAVSLRGSFRAKRTPDRFSP